VIADIVFDLPLSRPFSYFVPPGLVVAVGQRVRAPLKGRARVGMVVAVREGAVEGLRAVERVVEAAPILSRAALERLLPADRSRRPSLGGGAGFTPSRIARTYRRASRDAAPELPWVLVLSDEQRILFRERGQVLAASLLQYVDATRPETAAHHLKAASVTAAEYGREAATLGLSLSQTVEAFLRFRTPFHHELAVAARRRGFDAAETTDLLETAERAMDRLLVATMSGHGLAKSR